MIPIGKPVPAFDRHHPSRAALLQRLEKQGIATRQGTHAPIALAYYANKYGLKHEDFPNAWLADQLSLALP
jgi:perosamine synthetase